MDAEGCTRVGQAITRGNKRPGLIARPWRRRHVKTERALPTHVDDLPNAEKAWRVEAYRQMVEVEGTLTFLPGVALVGRRD
jgi:hypothetical protein